MEPPEEEKDNVEELPERLFGRCPICNAIVSLAD